MIIFLVLHQYKVHNVVNSAPQETVLVAKDPWFSLEHWQHSIEHGLLVSSTADGCCVISAGTTDRKHPTGDMYPSQHGHHLPDTFSSHKTTPPI